VFEGDFWGETVAEFSHSLGRFLPIAMQYGERLVRAPYQPLSSGFLISEIEPLLSRVKQTTVTYFLCADKQQLAAISVRRKLF
jgi:hypothetical protein